MDPRLLSAQSVDSVDALYSFIQADPCILQRFDVLPFIHTPLHEASFTGNIDLAMELMILQPSFAKKLNEDGLSPLHLAVENHKVELAQELIKFDPNLVRIRGRGGTTPLHLVAEKGDADLLTKFLFVCPESIRDANVNGETALHIMVKNDRHEELEVLRGWMQRMLISDALSTEKHILNTRDRDGNTALHLAAYKNDSKALKELLECMSLNRNIQNKSGMTALDLLRAKGSHMNIKETEKIIKDSGGKTRDSVTTVSTMSEFLKTPVSFREHCSTGLARYKSNMADGTRNALLVITALIITAIYQTAVQPEDDQDFIKDNDVVTKIVLLWGFNTIAYFLAMALTFLLIPFGGTYTWWFICITLPLDCSYVVSTYMKYKLGRHVIPITLIYMYVIVILGFFLGLLVFYVRWRRTTRKNGPEPKSELISEGFKTVV
ncbi:ankyrin repeat-containing protein BDA1 isoform X1 [Raphanus sativus]|uniref:Ankyrin repeat-containing protein BDA1 isoform X1 n=2 Tax=Raphanus sativus TaxID=3726 RepID=A0A9W3CFA8_RAPSA|nr:ankyrin repeat-containing protein BDA1 isoform X1 [Raphanus sativus]XP_056850233.1 ankyrin repeat-containing protein BDA1 isoform X1 [Raphanus sativus]